jgi:hypothetical protein
MPSLLLLVSALWLGGCHKDKTAHADKAAVKDSARLLRDAAAARQSLAGLEPLLSVLNTQFVELHRDFDPLSPGLPGFGETRGKFYASAEGLGMLNAKLAWLSGRVDAAVQAGDQASLDETSRDIAHTFEEVRRVERAALELRHEVLPFKGKADELQLLGKSSCE